MGNSNDINVFREYSSINWERLLLVLFLVLGCILFGLLYGLA